MLKSIESIVGATLLILSLIVFLSGMVLRLAGFSVGGWIEELTIYLVVWGLILAVASCVTFGEHVRADFFLRLIGERFRFFADILASVSGFLLCHLMAWFCWLVVEFAMAWDERGPYYLQIPTAWYYAALPASMTLCSIRYIVNLLKIIKGA